MVNNEAQQQSLQGNDRALNGVLSGSAIGDLDRHVLEPFAMWRDYMPRAFARELPELRRPIIAEDVETRCERLGEALALSPPPDQLWVGGRPAMNIPESGAIVCAQAAAER